MFFFPKKIGWYKLFPGFSGKTRGKTLVTAISAILPTTLVIVLIGCCICYYNRKKRIEGLDVTKYKKT